MRPSLQLLARARGVARHHRPAGGHRLPHLVRHHPRRLGARAEHPQADRRTGHRRAQLLVGHPALPGEARGAIAGELGLQPRPELPVADQAQRRRGGGPGRLDHRPDAVERGELAVEERVRRAVGLGQVREAVGLGAHRDHHDPLARHVEALREPGGARLGVRHHQVGEPQREAVDAGQRRGGRRGRRGPRSPASVSASEIIMFDHQGHPPGARHAPGRHGVGLGGIAGHHGVHPALAGDLAGQAAPGPRVAQARARERPGAQEGPRLVPLPLPHRPVMLHHLHPDLAQPPHEHPRARVVPLVGAEPHHPHDEPPGALSG